MNDILTRFSQVYPFLKKEGIVKGVEIFAKSIGIHRTNYYKIINGEKALMLHHVADLIQIYKISPNWLFLGEGEIMNVIADSMKEAEKKLRLNK